MKSNVSSFPNKGSKRTAIITYTIIATTALSVGIASGIILKHTIGQTTIDYEGFNPEEFRMDSKKLLNEYNKNPRKNFSPAELINIGLEKYRECENSFSFGIGAAQTVVNQTVRNAQIKNGNRYFEESISKSSMVSIANRVIQVDHSIDLYKGKAVESDVGQYKDNKVSYVDTDYKTNWGKTLDEMFIYLISNETVLDEGSDIKRKDETIEVTVNLNPDVATYYYKIQMKTISSLDSLPTFKSVKHVYTFDNDMNLLTCTVDENYAASMGIKANIHNVIDYYYFANEYLKIPELDEEIDYSYKGELNYEKDN